MIVRRSSTIRTPLLEVVMPGFTLVAIALCALVAAVAASQPSASAGIQSDSTKRRAGSITGRLINESNQPIPNAAVYVRKAGVASGPSRSVGTDEEGKFRVDDLSPGAYVIFANVPGYVPATEPAVPEYYHPGEAVTLHMIKGGVITGTVTNSAGEPMVGVRVNSIRIRDAEGRPIRGTGPSGNSRQTDDRGIYRIYGIAPGSYLVVASGAGQMNYPASAYDGDVPTYYPSTIRDAATEIPIHSGDEITGIDIRYRGDRGYIVSGTLSGSLSTDSLQRPTFLTLTHTASGAIESRTYVQVRDARGFALYGVPDGEYELIAQADIGPDGSAASPPRHVVVKGSDVTGIELSLAPLGSISGRAVLERIPESERTSECKTKRATSLDELVVASRREEKSGAKDQATPGLFAFSEGSPDEKGQFKILNLTAGRYRLEARLPAEDWFVRSITKPGPAASKQNDVGGAGLAVTSGQRITDLTVTVAEGAAALRGKVTPATEGSRLPAQLRVHLIPAEPESADDAIRFADAKVDYEGSFSVTNLAPGRYYVLARSIPDDQLMDRNPQPLAWDPAARAKLRREAQAMNALIDLQRCQQAKEYVLKYTPAPARKAEPKKTE